MWLACVLSALLGTSASSFFSFKMNEGVVRARWTVQVLEPGEICGCRQRIMEFPALVREACFGSE